MSDIKAGDRVRATCGGSVIVGTVQWQDDSHVAVSLDGCRGINYFGLDEWVFGVLSLPSVPDVVGTVIKDRDGEVWHRNAEGWRATAPTLLWLTVGRTRDLSLADVERNYGPLTVLARRAGDTMSNVKVGDRVRVSRGEIAVTGAVLAAHSDAIEVAGDGFSMWVYLSHGNWTVEVLSQPIPDVEGTIVRDFEGRAWRRGANDWSHAGKVVATLASLDRFYGPVTLTPSDRATP